jgi:hypothetical protein
MLFYRTHLQEALRDTGISPALLIIAVAILAALGTAVGVGLWRGTKWGWWLGAFACVYGIARSLSALLIVLSLSEEPPEGARAPAYYVGRYSGRILVQLLILLYFFRERVLRYFGLEGLSKWKALAQLVGACLALLSSLRLLSWLVA